MNQADMQMFDVNPIDILESRKSARRLRFIQFLVATLAIYLIFTKVAVSNAILGYSLLIATIPTSALLAYLILFWRTEVHQLDFPQGYFLFEIYRYEELHELVIANENGYWLVPLALWSQAKRDRASFTPIVLEHPYVLPIEAHDKLWLVTFVWRNDNDADFLKYLTGLVKWYKENNGEDEYEVESALGEAGHEYLEKLLAGGDKLEQATLTDGAIKPLGYHIDDFTESKSAKPKRVTE